MKALRILAGVKARAHIAQYGLTPSEIRAVPAAAGGPKGLLLKHLDQFVFGDWLANNKHPIHLVGASVGAWRMACAASSAPAAAFEALTRLYMDEQHYAVKVSTSDIDAACARILDQLVEPYCSSLLAQQRYQVHMLTVRGIGALSHPTQGHKRGYAKTVLANTLSRQYLGRSLERVAFHHGTPLPFLPASQADTVLSGFDGLPTRNLKLNSDNLTSVLAASGAIPLILSPVQTIAHAPAGPYWDGGISDYHIHWPWPCLGGITLYPHFAPHIVPGWLDKFLKHRRAHRLETRHWLDNTVLLCPSEAFVRNLPNQKIPDRQDFKHFGLDWQSREAAWKTSIAAAEQLADEFSQFVRNPAAHTIEALN
jgi:Patatin-like phospholipase